MPAKKADTETTATTTPKPRKPRAKKAATAPVATEPVTPPPPPTCSCGKVLDWRDRTYGRDGQCKRCNERMARVKARGTFTSAATYCAVLATRQQWKKRAHHQTAMRDLPERDRALALRKRGKRG